MTGRMAWSACDSGTAKSFTSRKAGVVPTRAAIRGRTNSSERPRYSTGTPGSATSSPRPSRTRKPGAVPNRFGTTWAPRGNRACLALFGVISRPSFRKRSRMASSEGSCTSSGTPMAAATTSAVRSSSVGPRPPLITTRSDREVVSRSADGEVVPVVGDQRLAPRHHAQVPEPVHQPHRVGVEDLAGEELVAGGEELDVEGSRGGSGHGVSSMHHQWMSPVQPRRRVSPSWRKARAKAA